MELDLKLYCDITNPNWNCPIFAQVVKEDIDNNYVSLEKLELTNMMSVIEYIVDKYDYLPEYIISKYIDDDMFKYTFNSLPYGFPKYHLENNSVFYNRKIFELFYLP